jgi:hypothetical protein
MFERMTSAERIALAKAKMERVLEHFLYVVELHSNNAFIVYSGVLVDRGRMFTRYNRPHPIAVRWRFEHAMADFKAQWLS